MQLLKKHHHGERPDHLFFEHNCLNHPLLSKKSLNTHVILPPPPEKLFLLFNISVIFKKRISQQLSNFNHRMLKQNPTSPTSSSKCASMALGGRLDVKIWPRVGLLCGVVARSRLREPDPRGSKGMCKWLICNSNNQGEDIKLAVKQERKVLRKCLHSSLRPF